jgi:photosystem II stability/assembly factor-like uncharacterized protein
MALIRRATRPVASLVAVLLATFAVSACGDDEPDDGPVVSDPGPIHVHGLGINPRDGALFIATHTGLFRAGPSETQASRVGGRYQDTMGFTVVGPDRFLGSGHPDGRDKLPPFLGLIESRDGGESWKPISLLGKSDFHVLEAAGERVYGFGSDFESRRPQFLVSSDGGKTWDERRVPEPLISLALHPDDPDRLIASGESAIFESRDGGESWRRRAPAAGLLAWRSPNELIVIAADGAVRSSDDGASWREVGDVGGQPAAFEAERDGLYVGLHDGTIRRSTTGGRSWSVRSRP